MPIKDEILIPQNKDTSFGGDVLPGTDGRWSLGSLTKRWLKVIAKIVQAINIVYTGNLKPTRNSGTYTGFVFVPLPVPYTHDSFNGDSFSDVGSNTKIENTGWSTTIPAEAKALLLRIMCRDSGSAGTAGLYFAVRPSSTATIGSLVCRLGEITNDQYADATGVVSCTDGDIWYICNASGTSTLDVWIWCFGYWI